MSIEEAFDKILAEGGEELKKDGEQVHIEALSDALFRAAMHPETEVRLTYRTTSQAAAAWTWMVWAVKRLDRYNQEKSSMFDVELINGSGIMFWTDEDVAKEAASSG